jgi:hypothetical protein
VADQTMTGTENMMLSLHESLICETQIMSRDPAMQWHPGKSAPFAVRVGPAQVTVM